MPDRNAGPRRPRVLARMAAQAALCRSPSSEVVDDTAMVTIPDAVDARPVGALFRGALAGSLALAFVITTPVNRWMTGRGKGHAVVHAYR